MDENDIDREIETSKLTSGNLRNPQHVINKNNIKEVKNASEINKRITNFQVTT